MTSSSLHKKQESSPSVEHHKIAEITDDELIDLCQRNHRTAWEEFFRRFTPTIKRGIRSIFINNSRFDLLNNEDVLWDIHAKIVEKLYRDQGLEQYEDQPAGIRAWLKALARNQTRDWFKKEKRIKRLPQKQSEDEMISLSTPLRVGHDTILQDIIPHNPDPDDELKRSLQASMDGITAIDNSKKQWALRLSVILYEPLSKSEIRELAAFNDCPFEELAARLEEMIKQLQQREEKRLEKIGRAVLLWHEIKRMRASLFEQSKVNSSESRVAIEELKARIAKKTDQREILLRSGRKPPRPSNLDIARLIGLPEGKKDQVSNLIDKAREDLLKRLRNR